MFVVRKHVSLMLITLVSLLFIEPRVHASLGSNDNSVESDRRSLKGTVKTTTFNNFTVREITTPNGTSIREYISPDGTVFGITWRGLVQPDLQVLLGNYHGEYLEREAHKERKVGRGRETLTSANIVVEKEGHMRDVKGRAYLPSAIPDGVTLEDLQ